MNTDDEERYLCQKIDSIYQEYRSIAEPYITRLVSIRNMKPPPPLVVMFQDLAAPDRQRIQAQVDAMFDTPQEYTREQRLQDEAELMPGVAPSVKASS